MIVGVVETAAFGGLEDRSGTPYIYMPLKQIGVQGISIFVRPTGSVTDLTFEASRETTVEEINAIVKAAADTWLKSLERKPDAAGKEALKREYARYDLLWKALDEKTLISQRADFIRGMFDEGAWPLKPGRS